jgi:hypothetical protein
LTFDAALSVSVIMDQMLPVNASKVKSAALQKLRLHDRF